MKNATKIIIKAIKELRESAASLQDKDAGYAAEKAKLDAIMPSADGAGADDGTGIMIIRTEKLDISTNNEATVKDITSPVQNMHLLRSYKTFYKLITAINNYYAGQTDADVESDVALNGKKMVKDVLEGLYNDKSEDAIKADVKQYLFITICKIADQL